VSKKLQFTVREVWSGGENKGKVVAKFRYLPDARLAAQGLNKYIWPSSDIDAPPFSVWYKGERVKYQ
jgi:hypothetical protein